MTQFRHNDGYISHIDRSIPYWARLFFPKQHPVTVLSDPVAASESREDILDEFLSKFPDAAFYHIDYETASILSKKGFYINTMGHNHTLDLKGFEGSWISHKSLKRDSQKARREGVQIVEGSLQDFPTADLQRVSEAWVKNQTNPSSFQTFLTRPLVLKAEPDVRYFFAIKDNQLIGFRIFDPLYNNGAIYGYYANATRVLPSAPRGTGYLLALSAITKFKAEKKDVVSLGLAPFSLPSTESYKHSRFTKTIFRTIYQNGPPFYNFRGLKNHKKRFHGFEYPIFFATREKLPIRHLMFSFFLTLGMFGKNKN